VDTGTDVYTAGLQRFTPLGKPNIVFITREDIGTELSTVAGASDAYSDVTVAAAYVLKGEYRFEFGGKLLSKAFAQGMEFQPGWESTFETKHWTIGVERKHYLGTIQNYVLYNHPSSAPANFHMSAELSFPSAENKEDGILTISASGNTEENQYYSFE
jgi:hypothetical protein